jgi:hypothetical protein
MAWGFIMQGKALFTSYTERSGQRETRVLVALRSIADLVVQGKYQASHHFKLQVFTLHTSIQDCKEATLESLALATDRQSEPSLMNRFIILGRKRSKEKRRAGVPLHDTKKRVCKGNIRLFGLRWVFTQCKHLR